jgi:hypothetical protein
MGHGLDRVSREVVQHPRELGLVEARRGAIFELDDERDARALELARELPLESPKNLARYTLRTKMLRSPRANSSTSRCMAVSTIELLQDEALVVGARAASSSAAMSCT